MHIELQQRGIEFSQLFKKYDHLRPALLERMPPMETARPQANGIIGMVNGEPDIDEDKSTILETDVVTSDSVHKQFTDLDSSFILLDSTYTSCEIKIFYFCRMHFWICLAQLI